MLSSCLQIVPEWRRGLLHVYTLKRQAQPPWDWKLGNIFHCWQHLLFSFKENHWCSSNKLLPPVLIKWYLVCCCMCHARECFYITAEAQGTHLFRLFLMGLEEKPFFLENLFFPSFSTVSHIGLQQKKISTSNLGFQKWTMVLVGKQNNQRFPRWIWSFGAVRKATPHSRG